ncbi:5'(3')-deoxyribonucleotidase [Flavobacterium sp. ASW18X]|uniref:5' nucleotidase, NT5C type n=1 Tax=Flavobacterium sp. ASW18X TaxID=2572595 RepID=UPI0010AE181E|nr:5'(3')-deoxyribonucleotidase [Flavobacterium sp. ASW18X]TKD59138.1 5'(3')-deoxyribonucleotidase [Flavobacterium sp. ASW18X]
MRIFIDMDEVIADTYQAHIDLHNSKYGTNFTKDDCYGKEFWMCVEKEHQQEVRDHAYQIGFFKDLKVIGNAVEVIKSLSKKHEVYIASAAMQFPNSLIEKSDWLDEHLPFIPWQNRILLGHKHVLKGDVLIDDRSFNLETFEGRAIQFTSPHNVHTTAFERADDWNIVASLLL